MLSTCRCDPMKDRYYLLHCTNNVIVNFYLLFSAFFWLLALLVSSLIWIIVIPLKDTPAFTLPLSVILQELFRWLYFKLLKYEWVLCCSDCFVRKWVSERVSEWVSEWVSKCNGLFYELVGVWSILFNIYLFESSRKADHLLEIVSDDKSDLRKHKIAYGQIVILSCSFTLSL